MQGSKIPGQDEGIYRVAFSTAKKDGTNPGWSASIQLLGTQAEYDEDGNDILLFGLYYRLRTCPVNKLIDLCPGTNLMAHLFISN